MLPLYFQILLVENELLSDNEKDKKQKNDVQHRSKLKSDVIRHLRIEFHRRGMDSWG